MKNTVRILTLVVLISICWVEAALADITIDGESVHVETDAYTVRFDKGVMSYIHNKRTGETYTIPASPRNRREYCGYREAPMGCLGKAQCRRVNPNGTG